MADANNKSNAEPSDQINTEQFESIIQKHLEPIRQALHETIEKLRSEVDAIKLVADNAWKLAQQNEKTIKQLQADNNMLKNQMRESSLNHKALEELIESRTNRQLHKTLIFKVILENGEIDANNNQRPETWNDTEKILAEKISEICDVSLRDARKMIERCHRANTSPNYKGTGPRPIFAAFFSWKESEFVKNEFRKNNVNNADCRIYSEQKFGPLTTKRRNQAMLYRKKLKDEGNIVRGYVAFPAKLMVKRTHAREDKYFEEKDFSKVEVSFSN